ncbi:ABC transporter permease [Catenulispora rubra]|uniref:ABC transporter permease n=1 Tax=Catenulispora rubra TaxID=280293 RepID=UPI0018922D3F|nr:ABC transporter permease [Catenulispora rubra]
MSPPPAIGPGLAPAGGSDPSWWDVPGQIEKAIDTWFGDLVKSALEPVLKLVGSTLLSSPDLSDGRVAQVWTGVLITANTLYILFFLAGAVIVMGHQTVQTRYSMKEIAPRLVIGAIASNASLWAICQTVSLGNALAAALMGGKLSAEGIGSRLTSMVVDRLFLPSGITQLFLVLLGGAVAVMGVVLLVTCLIRAATLLTLTAGSPLALACHALPQTDPLARLWWRAIIGCLATQVAQALVLVICVQIFFDPNADTIFGLPSDGGLVDLLLCLVLLFTLIKIPIWTTRVVLGRSAMGATMVGRLARSFVYYKAFTVARSRLGGQGSQQRVSGVWHNNFRPGPPAPGAGLAPFQGPRPGGGGGHSGWSPRPETVTATATVHRNGPTSGAEASDEPHAQRTNSLPATIPPGPSRRPLALPPGRSTRLDRLAKERAENPLSNRGVQDGLFPPIRSTSPRQANPPSSTTQVTRRPGGQGERPSTDPRPRTSATRSDPSTVRAPSAPTKRTSTPKPGGSSAEKRQGTDRQ